MGNEKEFVILISFIAFNATFVTANPLFTSPPYVVTPASYGRTPQVAFNMGTGMVLVAARDSADKALAALHSLGQEAGVIGEIVSGEEKVALC